MGVKSPGSKVLKVKWDQTGVLTRIKGVRAEEELIQSPN